MLPYLPWLLWNTTNKIPAYNIQLINGRYCRKIDWEADEVYISGLPACIPPILGPQRA